MRGPMHKFLPACIAAGMVGLSGLSASAALSSADPDADSFSFALKSDRSRRLAMRVAWQQRMTEGMRHERELYRRRCWSGPCRAQ